MMHRIGTRQRMRELRILLVSALILVQVSQSFLSIEPSGRRMSASSEKATIILASKIQWCPSCIAFNQVHLQYPDSLWRRLTSSVPRREYALSNLTCTFGQTGSDHDDTVVPHFSGMILLLGASSSGKSTILKLIEGTETPTDGSVRIFTTKERGNNASSDFAGSAKPILLDDRSPLPRLQNTVETELVAILQRTIRELPKSTLILQSFVEELSTIVDLPLNNLLSNLSPSQYYKFRLAQAVVESSLGFVKLETSLKSTTTAMTEPICLPSPIVLLDEWMDTETSQVVSKVVNPTLQNIVDKLGGVVICVTHKPYLFDNAKSTTNVDWSKQFSSNDATVHSTRMTKITMSAGKVLNMETMK
jgi:ABC-type lipoprotein export system ATPase subunit